MPSRLWGHSHGPTVIRAIRLGRPDAAIVLLCKKQYVDFFLNPSILSEEVIALPQSKRFSLFRSFLKPRKHYPDAMLLFTNSFRGDLEAFLIGAKYASGWLKTPKTFVECDLGSP